MSNSASPSRATRNGGFSVIYRQGGNARFRWRRVLLAFDSLDSALDCVADLERSGYHAQAARSEFWRHGLPETFDADQRVDDVEHRADGWTYSRA